jgi:hypothetical protein
MRLYGAALLAALAAMSAVSAHTHHRVSKKTPPAASASKGTPSDTARDPKDVLLDRKLKSLCRGC